ncbi:MAG: hypothetical protein A2563_02095 [Candidatus Magasanikbacteria bacterium RIFOXYD1_FULL_40_23]|uniref:PDZ domain-containing protein n=1 Tax=Candidatus Magasanikbacteria bacterium RIFOXYD1_FULL_40_23 TaxID=1798705 RepID=A0A1F6PB43_9BACT|nr:MAG: hypothetical protein A2563_02095 [Candidatus Magasanikbacteria bacterium RIFOXYD1_FULL_40_23]
MVPPHLPPKTSSIETHRHLQRLKLLLAIVVFSVIAGASGASMMIGWIWPRFADGDVWITSYTNSGMSRAQLETRIREEISTRVVSVHRGTTSVGGVNYFNKKIGDGIMLSSDGWLAMYQPRYDGNYKNIYIAVDGGNIFQPEKAVWDKYSGVLYLKIQNEQFKVVGFADEGSDLDDIFVWQNDNWYHGTVLYPIFNYKIPHLDTAPIKSYSLNGSFNAGQIAINNQGRVVGFVADNNLLLPGFYITRVLSQVLSQQALSYPSLGVEGWFGEEQTIFTVSETKLKAGEKARGFLVSGVWSVGSVLRKGDLLLEVNGRIVAPDNLWYIINNNESVKVKILRSGKTLEVEVKVVATK